MSNENTEEEIYGLRTLEAKTWYRIKRREIQTPLDGVATMQMVEEQVIVVDGRTITSGDVVYNFTFDKENPEHIALLLSLDDMWKEKASKE
jgi:hypothetical protein